MTHASSAVEDFMDALGRLDFAALERTMARDVQFRAIVPPGFREATGSREAAEMIGRWFASASEGRILSRESGTVGDRAFANYRVGVVDEGEPVVAEQRMLCTLRDGKIATLDFLCSGFHAV